MIVPLINSHTKKNCVCFSDRPVYVGKALVQQNSGSKDTIKTYTVTTIYVFVCLLPYPGAASKLKRILIRN